MKSQGPSLILVNGHSDFKVKCLTFGLYTQVSDSGPQGPLVCNFQKLITTLKLLHFPVLFKSLTLHLKQLLQRA